MHLVNIAEHHFLDGVVFQDFSDNSTIASSNNQHLLRVRMTRQGKMSDHLLVSAVLDESLC